MDAINHTAVQEKRLQNPAYNLIRTEEQAQWIILFWMEGWDMTSV